MGLFDKFLSVMQLNDDDDYEDDDDFYDDDNEEEETPRKRKTSKRNIEEDDNLVNINDNKKPLKTSKTSSKVTQLRPTKRQGNSMEVCVIKPTSVENSREITETLLSNRTIILNLEGLDVEIAQRIIDFTSGSCFAINGNLQKVSNYIFIITPSNVDISGDIQEILKGAFDVPMLQSEF